MFSVRLQLQELKRFKFNFPLASKSELITDVRTRQTNTKNIADLFPSDAGELPYANGGNPISGVNAVMAAPRHVDRCHGTHGNGLEREDNGRK